jgi:hypothetical protein
MLISQPYINTYESKKNETLIRGSKCFFLLQLYNEPAPAIEDLKEKTSALELQLIRFPLFRWRKRPLRALKTACHLPVLVSNYALVGRHKLDLDGLKVVAQALQQNQAVFVFGYQDNTWFDAGRLLVSDKSGPETGRQTVAEAIRGVLGSLPPHPVSGPILQHLLHTLTCVPSTLK